MFPLFRFCSVWLARITGAPRYLPDQLFIRYRREDRDARGSTCITRAGQRADVYYTRRSQQEHPPATGPLGEQLFFHPIGGPLFSLSARFLDTRKSFQPVLMCYRTFHNCITPIRKTAV